MRASLHALLSSSIDYAGMFPPAKLPFGEAMANFVRYRTHPEGWLLNRLVCPVQQLGQLVTNLPMSIVGRSADQGATFFAVLDEDLAVLDAFQRRGRNPRIQAFDLRLPGEIVADDTEQRAFFERCLRHLAKLGSPSPFVSFEAGFAGDWRQTLSSLLAAMHEAAGERFGFKLRCGGLEASAFPSIEQVGFVLSRCRELAIPVKFTAGLHHPFRHFDKALSTSVHGFVNIFAAGAAAFAHRCGEEVVCKILADEHPNHFAFDEDGFRWQQVHVGLDAIQDSRRLFTTFGSCSFDEPAAGLRRIA